MTRHFTALVVTYNRKQLLQRCLEALWHQTRRPDRIIVVDNASSDGTPDMLRSAGWLTRPGFEILVQPCNVGGAGGFAAGMAHAVQSGGDWLWLMDDDAVPHPQALQKLNDIALDGNNVYGSVALSGERLSWPMLGINGTCGDTIYTKADLPDVACVQFIPFLGLLVSRDLIRRIGVPDPGFFIAADDVDYCFRARSAGANIILVGQSWIEHPASERYCLPLPWRPFYSLKLVPWKRYYDVRNRILVAKNHYGLATYYKTVPGSFLRLLATLIYERDRIRQIWAFIAGLIDGLLGKKGRRHEAWGLRP